MSWEYRVIRRVYGRDGCDIEETEYAIYEAYSDRAEKTHSISADPVFPHGETKEELERALVDYFHALRKPVLRYEDF